MEPDEKTLKECADWVAEQVSEELGGFVSSELVDLVIELDMGVRAELNDARIDHRTMSEHLIPRLEAAGAPVKTGGVTRELVEEILHWLDEALAMAGYSRDVRR
ncbi:MAG: hypothetical protein EXR66_03130 [Dehalococcoidia bacterium]|nr:hypothetical protein [Dehalococcoidia bacterium]